MYFGAEHFIGFLTLVPSAQWYSNLRERERGERGGGGRERERGEGERGRGEGERGGGVVHLKCPIKVKIQRHKSTCIASTM